MICKYCGREITSEKVFRIHVKKCEQKAENETDELFSLRKKELIDMAKKQGIKIRSNVTKQELIQALNEKAVGDEK